MEVHRGEVFYAALFGADQKRVDQALDVSLGLTSY